MGTATARRLDREALASERQAILDGLGRTEQEMRVRANGYLLTEDEAAAWRRLEALAWLAGE
jgi:regulator of protease activity HflC (stomatin/prohibitin superfamily)